jgi:hypothetical protein
LIRGRSAGRTTKHRHSLGHRFPVPFLSISAWRYPIIHQTPHN